MEKADQNYDFDNLGRDANKPPGMSGCAKVGIGCGIAFVVLAIAVGIGVWYVAQNARELGAEFAAAALKSALEELKLPDDQEQRIFTRIDNVSQMFASGEITMEQVGQIFEGIGQGPLLSAGMALAVERGYLDKSGFDDDEKEAARIVIQRFTHGALHGTIPQPAVDSVLDTISTVDPQNNNSREFRSPISDDELREFVAAAEEAADAHEVPEEVPEVNFADEFDKAVDRALGLAPPEEVTPEEVTGEDPPVEENGDDSPAN